MEVMIVDGRAADCHMALTPGAVNLPPVFTGSDVLLVYHLPHRIWNYLCSLSFDLFLMVRLKRRRKGLWFNCSIVYAFRLCMRFFVLFVLFSAPAGEKPPIQDQPKKERILIPCFQMLKRCFQTSSLSQHILLNVLLQISDCLQLHNSCIAWIT